MAQAAFSLQLKLVCISKVGDWDCRKSVEYILTFS